MHADNGKWFDMDGDKWTGPYVCVRDIEWIEEDIYMEEHHSGAKESLTAANGGESIMILSYLSLN